MNTIKRLMTVGPLTRTSKTCSTCSITWQVKASSWVCGSKQSPHIKLLFDLADSSPDFKDFRFFAHYNQALNLYSQQQFKPAITALQQTLALSDTTAEQYFVNLSQALLTIAYFRDQQTQAAVAAGEQFLAAAEQAESLAVMREKIELIIDPCTR